MRSKVDEEYFRKNRVPFEEVDVERDHDAAREIWRARKGV